jgi:hypothetical protein
MKIIKCSSCGEDHENITIKWAKEEDFLTIDFLENIKQTFQGTFLCPKTKAIVFVSKEEN